MGVVAEPGTCGECGERRPVRSAKRAGGGNYRRPPRWYSTNVCEPCARHMVAVAPDRAGAVVNRWEVRTLRNAWRLDEEGN